MREGVVRSSSSHRSTPGPGDQIFARQIVLAMTGLFVLNLLLRVFYLRFDFVNGDEGVRALTAVRMLDGARLYADVVTDKPPGASLFYAAIFFLFGTSMKAVHLAAIVWNFASSITVYLVGARYYSKRVGLWAALLFVYFSTNYFTQDMMAANTELLMLVPYTASFCLFMIAEDAYAKDRALSARVALIAAGVLTALAALFKQIGVFNLVFFGLYEILLAWMASRRTRENQSSPPSFLHRVVGRLSLIGIGFVIVIAAFVLWLKSLNALGDFWRNGILLNMFYIDSEPVGLWIKFMLGRGLGYVFFNAVLWALAGWATLRAIKENKEHGVAMLNKQSHFDRTVILWGAVSLSAVMMSGRFYGHYFIPALPALSLLGARGVRLLSNALKEPARRRRAQVALGALGLLFVVGLLRCHHRTAVLAFETVTGTRSRWSGNWGMTSREQQAGVVSAFVRERIPAGEPLYIWGYAHDVFWRTGCRPASRYLTPYYLDGRFADAEATVSPSGEDSRNEAAANLIEDLRRTRPKLILDANGDFLSLPQPELMAFIKSNYLDAGEIGSPPLRVLRLRNAETQ